MIEKDWKEVFEETNCPHCRGAAKLVDVIKARIGPEPEKYETKCVVELHCTICHAVIDTFMQLTSDGIANAIIDGLGEDSEWLLDMDDETEAALARAIQRQASDAKVAAALAEALRFYANAWSDASIEASEARGDFDRLRLRHH
jgi:hypothetical protein